MIALGWAKSFCNTIGTKRTKRTGLAMSVDWGRPEVIGCAQTDAIDPDSDIGQNLMPQ
jgi:hypothetical protein